MNDDRNSQVYRKENEDVNAGRYRRNKLIFWCLVVALIDLLLFLLLIFLPDCCGGEPLPPQPVLHDTITHVVHDTIVVSQPTDTVPNDEMDRRVRDLGGNTNAVMRFTIEWNKLGNDVKSDVDAHVILPSGEEIYYKHKKATTGASLDVDKKMEAGVKVENIVWPRAETVKDGEYTFYIHQFNGRTVGEINARIIIGEMVTDFRINGPLEKESKIPIAIAEFYNGTLTNFKYNSSIAVQNQ